MKTVRTFKLKITSENNQFLEVSQNYLQAINWISQILFQRNKNTTAPNLSFKRILSNYKRKIQSAKPTNLFPFQTRHCYIPNYEI